MQAPHVNSVCFESLPLKVLEFWQKISKPFLNTFSFPLIISNHLSLISKTVLFLIEMFGLCEGHWYLKRLNKMNKLQVALDRHKLHRVEEPSQETQKLKSKVRTEFKVFCLAISLHWEVIWRCNNYCIETGMNPSLSPAPPHRIKLKLEVYSIFKHCF